MNCLNLIISHNASLIRVEFPEAFLQMEAYPDVPALKEPGYSP